jgi:TetR/AcrR family transcriptional repressor of nem operon
MAARRRSAKPSGEETRARIFLAAVKLFAEHGYEGTSVDRIVAAAGVAKGTFFIHFATKEAVIRELQKNQVVSARAARDAIMKKGGTAVDALRTTVTALGREVAKNRELSRAVIAANIVNPVLGGFAESVFGGIIQEMTDDVRRAQKDGELTSQVPAEIIAGTLITSYMGATMHFATAPRSRPLLALLSPVVEANLAGFAAKGGEPSSTARAASPASSPSTRQMQAASKKRRQ